MEKRLQLVPESVLFKVAEQAVTGVCNYMADGVKRGLHLANIYQKSQLPLKHFREIIRAGHHCLDLNLPMDAALYYQRWPWRAWNLECLPVKSSQILFDAAIGLSTCTGTAFSKKKQRRFLSLALEFSTTCNDPIRQVKLRVLIARTYVRSVRSNEAAKHLELAWEMLSPA